MVAIRKSGATFQDPLYGGHVVDIKLSSVIVRLHETFTGLPQERWDIRFMVNRLLFRRMHDSINKTDRNERILFPSTRHQKGYNAVPQSSFRLDRRIASNPRQSLAVQQIAMQDPGSIPFVIFGP
jgi:helicase MOV-10